MVFREVGSTMEEGAGPTSSEPEFISEESHGVLLSRFVVQRSPKWNKERDRVPTKLNYKMNHSATFKCTKIIIHPL